MKHKSIKNLEYIYNHYKTKVVLFRNVSRLDSFTLFKSSQNEEFNKYLNWGKPENLEEVILKIDNYINSKNHIAISFCKEDGLWCGIFVFEIYKDGVMLSLWTNPMYWKTVYPIHAAFAGIDILFKETNLKKIYAKISPDNNSMLKIVSRNGFKLIEKTKTLHTSGEYISANIYLLEKDNWLENIKSFYIKQSKY